jgi:hypothetical protein
VCFAFFRCDGLELTLVRSGDIVLMHHEKIRLSKKFKSSIRNGTNGFGAHASAVHGAYEPSAFLYTPKDGPSGHKDVVRCMYHDIQVRPGLLVDEL